VPGCGNHLFLEFCHIDGHARGGSREADNLLLLCWLHHWMFDHGLMTLRGPAEDPVFRNARGEVIGGPRAPPAE
jgi:hypothetical protein